MKKIEQITHQNVFRLFTLEDKLTTCDIARQQLALRRTQKLAKLHKEVDADAVVALVASTLPPPPLSGVALSPKARVSCAYAPSAHAQGLVGDDEDDCAELDFDVDEDFVRIATTQSPTRSIRPHHDNLDAYACDFSEATSDHEDHLTNLVNDTHVNKFKDTPRTQRHMISLDSLCMHAKHVAFWNLGITEGFINKHFFSSQLPQ